MSPRVNVLSETPGLISDMKSEMNGVKAKDRLGGIRGLKNGRWMVGCEVGSGKRWRICLVERIASQQCGLGLQ
ncbi:Hypothetical predicted protein [Octopus vulgaris]|uniref:Uncharacterized protein n=1 Tax=Octopus vulgaris TaxID=6645 RepID=A0AA36BKG0_OCTVU|nr:Hypothetical predicted protein [Octopus vulgaris]